MHHKHEDLQNPGKPIVPPWKADTGSLEQALDLIQGPCPKEYRERVIEDDFLGSISGTNVHMHPHTYAHTSGNMHIHTQEKMVS